MASRCAAATRAATPRRPREDRLRHLLDFDQASHEVHPLVPPFFNAVVSAQIAHLPVDGGGLAPRLRLDRPAAAAAADHPPGRRRRGDHPGRHLPGQPPPVVALPHPRTGGRLQRGPVRRGHLGDRAARTVGPPHHRTPGRGRPGHPARPRWGRDVRLAPADLLADGAAAGRRRPVLRHGQRDLRAVRHRSAAPVHRRLEPLRPTGNPRRPPSRRSSSGWRPSWSTATPAGVPTAVGRQPCCPAWSTSCWRSSGSR